jgi:hypothetical protein
MAAPPTSRAASARKAEVAATKFSGPSSVSGVDCVVADVLGVVTIIAAPALDSSVTTYKYSLARIVKVEVI